MIGIYKITNKINGKSYIGQSVNIKKRWKKHRELKNTTQEPQCNYPLYRAFKKYGLSNFSFEIIEECTSDMLNIREIYWIDFYDTYRNGYNQTNGGNSYTKSKITCDQLDEITDLLKNTNIPMVKIAKNYNISATEVWYINRGNVFYRENISYPIRIKVPKKKKVIKKKKVPKKKKVIKQKKQKTTKKNYCPLCGKEIALESKLCKHCYNNNRISKKPSKLELSNMIIDIPIETIGKKYDVSGNSVRKWLKSYNLPYRYAEIQKYKNIKI